MKNKLNLRKYNKKDFERHIELLVMNKVYKKLDSKTKESEKEWLNNVINNYQKKKPTFFVLAITLNKKLIGNLVIEKINYQKKNANIGFWIGKNYWNKGYASKALNLFLKKINKIFEIKLFYAETKIHNLGSQKVLEKNNFNKLKRKANILLWEKGLR